MRNSLTHSHSNRERESARLQQYCAAACSRAACRSFPRSIEEHRSDLLTRLALMTRRTSTLSSSVVSFAALVPPHISMDREYSHCTQYFRAFKRQEVPASYRKQYTHKNIYFIVYCTLLYVYICTVRVCLSDADLTVHYADEDSERERERKAPRLSTFEHFPDRVVPSPEKHSREV